MDQRLFLQSKLFNPTPNSEEKQFLESLNPFLIELEIGFVHFFAETIFISLP